MADDKMSSTKCLYCGNVLANPKEYEIKDKGFCCSKECQRKAENAQNKPFDFQLPRYYLTFFGLGVILFIVNDFTLKLESFNHIIGIVWGAFIVLVSFISKPIFSFSIKRSRIFTVALGLFVIIMSVFSLIDI